MIFIDIKDWLDKICTIFDFIMSKNNKYYCKVSNLQNILNRYWNIKLVKQILILLLIMWEQKFNIFSFKILTKFIDVFNSLKN